MQVSTARKKKLPISMVLLLLAKKQEWDTQISKIKKKTQKLYIFFILPDRVRVILMPHHHLM